jgi:hypothetical protein
MSIIEYGHHSPSALNLFCASTSLFVLEKIIGISRPVGAPAHRGVAVEAGVAHGLLHPDAPLANCIKAAVVRYDTIAALSSDARREKYRETIEGMVTQALAELRPYGVPSHVQGLMQCIQTASVCPSSDFSILCGSSTASLWT